MTTLRDVIIPAGGGIPEAYARAAGTPYRALAPLGPDRRPVMQIVVEALRASGRVRKIVGVAAAPVAETIEGVDHWLPAGESGAGNILRGLDTLDAPEVPALVCASDLPLLTAEAVRGFAEGCEADADVTVGLVRAASYEAAYPDAPASQWVSLRDAGPVTISCLFGIRPAALLRGEAPLTRVFESRKSQWRMAQILGPRLLWQWATKSLTLAAIIARSETILGARTQVLHDIPPGLSFDIDTEDDYTYANACLQRSAFPDADTARTL